MTRSVILLVLLALPLSVFAQTDLTGLKFCIDPGHGGNNPANDRLVIPDPGIEFWESESNFQKALLLKPLLEARGAQVILTRNTNSYPDDSQEPSLTARWSLANANNVDWFHSIHSNAAGGTNTSINRTLVLLKEDINTRTAAFPQAITMSSHMYNQIRAHLRTQSSVGNVSGVPGVYLDYTFYGGPNGGFNLGVLRGLVMPGELSEGSFHDFFPETRRLMNNSYRKMEAWSLLKAMLQYYAADADTNGIIAGLQTEEGTGKLRNGTVVRLLPENRIYQGDSFNNGFYMFDSVSPGPHSIVFETPLFKRDTVPIAVSAGGIHFLDRTLLFSSFPTVISATPAMNDTTTSVQGPVVIRFSRAMDTASVRQAVSFSPPAASSFQWSPDRTTATISPTLQYYTWYTVTLDSTARAENGLKVDLDGDEIGGDVFSFSFKTETGLQVPSLAYGQLKLNDTLSMNLVVKNRAPYQVVIQNVSGLSQPFATTLAFPDSIQGNDSLSIPVSFIPTTYGTFNRSITVSADSGTVFSSLSGSSPAPVVFRSHTFIGFGGVSTDTTKDWPTFFLTTSSINGGRIDSVYTKTANFRFTPQLTFPASMALGDTIRLTLTFAPPAPGSFSDSLVVLSNGSPSPAYVTLVGNGIAPSSVEKLAEVADRFDLLQNFPNPFNPETQIEFLIPTSSQVRLEIVDLLGRSVRVLADEYREPGAYRVVWDGRGKGGEKVASGIYFYRLTAGGAVFSKRMVLLK